MQSTRPRAGGRGNWSGNGHRVNIDYRGNLDEVRIEIYSYREDLLAQAVEQSKAIPGLKPKVRDPQLQGDYRRYFLSREATAGWYEEAVKLVRQFASRHSTFWGRVARDRNIDTPSQRGYGNADVWWAEVQEGMRVGDIATSYLSYRGHDRMITFDLDHYRDVLSVDVQSAGGEDVEPTHARLVIQLNLTLAPRDAYKYRRWGRTYEISWADSVAFANRLESGLKALFSGRRVALSHATLHVGVGDEEVLAPANLGLFIKEVKTNRNLTELHLVAHGPRGEFIGVHIDRDLRRMRLLAYTDFDRFKAFATELEQALRRMKLQETDDLDAEGTIQKENKWPTILVGILALVGALLGTEVFKAMREPPELLIDLPRAKDGLAEIDSPDLTVSWTYKRPQVFGRPMVDPNHQASLDLVRESDGTTLLQNRTERGRARVNGLKVGSYTLRVSGDGAFKALELRVKEQPAVPTPGARQTP